MGRSLEGVDDVTFRYAGQIIIIKERTLEARCVDLGQYDLVGEDRSMIYSLKYGTLAWSTLQIL